MTIWTRLRPKILESPIGRRIADGTFWSVFGSGLARVLTLVALLLTARLLGRELYGQFGFIRSTAMTFVAFSGFGIGLTATKYIAELLVSDKARAGRIVGLSYLFTFFSSLAVALVFYLAAPWLCEHRLQTPHLVGEMRLGAPLLFLMTFMGTQTGVMAGFQDFRHLARAALISGVMTIPAYTLGAWSGGIRGALVGVSAATALNVLLNSFFIYRNTRKHALRYSFFDSYREMSVLFHFSLPSLLCSVTYLFSAWICQLMVASQPGGDSELGVFYASSDVLTAILFIPHAFSPIFLPILSELQVHRHKMPEKMALFRKTVRIHLALNLLAVALPAVPAVLFSRQILGLYGTDFIDGYATLTVLCTVSLAFVVSMVVDQVVASLNKMWLNFAYCLLGAVVSLFVCYFLVDLGWGSLALAWAMLAGTLTRILFFAVYFSLFRLL